MALRLNRILWGVAGASALLWLATAPAQWRLLGAEGDGASSKTPSSESPADKPPAAESESAEDPLGPNGACYVCHMTFVKEELAKTHLTHKIACVKCHGLSEKHANDENIGATKPDITYRRTAVDASCQKCHEGHNASARKVVARFVERKLSPQKESVCTDCHGTHKIDRSQAGK